MLQIQRTAERFYGKQKRTDQKTSCTVSIRRVNGKNRHCNKNYMRGSDIFADAFNFLIYNGEARIQSQSLQERDVTELAVLFSNDSVKMKQKYNRNIAMY